MSHIGDRLKAILTERGISQRDFAEMAGTHEVSISRIVNGSRQPGLAMLTKLSSALGISISDLVGDGELPAAPAAEPASNAAEEQVLERLADVLQAAPAPRRARLLRYVRMLAKAASGGGDGRFRRPQARCAARSAEGDIMREAV